MNSLPKIKLGKSNHPKTAFDLSHDVHTTAAFGEMQPVLFQEMIPNSTLDVKVSEFTRLAPLVAPTFARVSTRYYHQFVPYEDIFHPFATMLADQVYNGVDQSYRPVSVPTMRIDCLTRAVINAGYYYTVYQKSGSTTNYTAMTVGYSAACTSVMNEYIIGMNAFVGSKILEANGDPRQPQHSAVLGRTVDNSVTLDGADFLLFSLDKSYIVAIKLKQTARRLRKILIGLGYQLNINDITKVSLLPIFCYYKAWFDSFAPQRTTTYKGTNAHKFMELCEQYNLSEESHYTTKAASLTAFDNFWKNELSQCYFIDNQDWIGSHTASITTAFNGEPTFPYIDVNNASTSATQPQNEQWRVSGSNLSGLKIDIAKRLYAYANKHTVLGGKIANLLRNIYGSDFLDDDTSNYIGSSVFDVQIGDVMSNTDTVGIAGDNTGAQIGEYAGKGVGFGEGGTLKFTSKTYGCWITLMAVVPKSTYNQGIDQTLLHTRKFDFYCPDFDALGMQATPMNAVVGSSSVAFSSGGTQGANTFGFTPRYSEMKVKGNICNGDISLRSTKTMMAPYQLDRVISENDIDYVEMVVDASGNTTYSGVSQVNNYSNLPVASEEWRTIGKYEWLGNYNRIFSEQGDSTRVDQRSVTSLIEPITMPDDRFIVHTALDIKYIAPMLSMSQSYETDGFGDTMEVEKS